MFNSIKKYSNIILTAIIVVIILFYIDGCTKNNADQKRIATLLAYEHIAKEYAAKDGTVVKYNSSVAVTPEDLKMVQDTLLSYIENLKLKIKNVNSTTIINQELRIDTIEVPIYLTDCEFDTTVIVTDSNYQMDIRVTNTGLTFNTLAFPNRMGITLAEKREKWFKQKESIVTVTNSNPYMQVDGISAYTFPKKKWLGTWWAHAAEGVILGGVASFLILK